MIQSNSQPEPYRLPIVKLPVKFDPDSIATGFQSRLPALGTSDFTNDALWYDVFSLTGIAPIVRSSQKIATIWNKLIITRQVELVKPFTEQVQTKRIADDSGWVEITFSFKALAPPILHFTAIFSLIPDDTQVVGGQWKVWMMRTILDQLDQQYGDVDHLYPDISNQDLIAQNHPHDELKLDCLVVGAGQAGLAVAGRLKALGLSYAAIDRNHAVGDNWRHRYDSAKMHTPREYAHLPFERTFSDEYPEWLSKNDLAKGYQEWVNRYGINVWLSTELISGKWNETCQKWTVQLKQPCGIKTVLCSHVVLAIGVGVQTPFLPLYEDRERFQGLVLHSIDYRNPSAWNQKHGVIIGSANTAHDVAEDMLDAGLASVTMVQRAATAIVPREQVYAAMTKLYNAHLPTKLADRERFTIPPLVRRQLVSPSKDPERYNELEKAGFMRKQRGPGGSFRGLCIDCGTLAKIAKGQIKMKSGTCPVRYTDKGLQFDDGSRLDADVIVFATGYKFNMPDIVQDIFGPDIVRKAYRLDRGEGELKGNYLPTGHPQLWTAGGNIGPARYFSRFLALQIKAAVLGTPLPIFDEQSLGE